MSETTDAAAVLSPAVRDYLDAPLRHTSLATRGADGTPHLAVVWFVRQDDAVLVNSRVGRRWPSELLADPRCAMTVVDHDVDADVYVALQAEASVAATGAEALADIQMLARRYGQDPSQFDGQERISFHLRPLRVTVHGEIER